MSLISMLWNSRSKPPMKRAEKISKFLLDTNEKFTLFLEKCSWAVYVIAGLLVLFSIYYYFYDYRRRMELKRRRQQAQRATERQVQRRRPGAAYRDHEIFRNVMQKVHKYVHPDQNSKSPYEPRRTRSGTVYGHFN